MKGLSDISTAVRIPIATTLIPSPGKKRCMDMYATYLAAWNRNSKEGKYIHCSWEITHSTIVLQNYGSKFGSNIVQSLPSLSNQYILRQGKVESVSSVGSLVILCMIQQSTLVPFTSHLWKE